MKHFYGAIKFILDEILSFLALIVLFIPFVIFALIIKCTSKGPVFFKQKRVGKNKKLFYMHKFRSMRMDAPHDAPTHQLNNADSYITSIGRFMRKYSIDELPQIIDILRGKMSIIGPRPALWNQFDLIEERDKYNANSVRPGLTGWAQINGRDELEIPIKAKFDGEYIERYGFIMDCRCFFGTIIKVFRHEGIVEGGTGELHKEEAIHLAEKMTAGIAVNKLTAEVAVSEDKQESENNEG